MLANRGAQTVEEPVVVNRVVFASLAAIFWPF
jgi:hypothetical protein